MERVLRDPALARDCAARGLLQARRFSWDASAARLLNVYASAVERRRSRR
jgi:hypothetical protein